MSQVRPFNGRIQNLEEVLHKTGWGLYYKFLVGFASFNSFTNAMAVMSLYFALPLSICDTLWIESNLIILHACVNLGRSLGAFLLCTIADFHGKKCMISKSLLLIFGSCFLVAFAHNIYTLFFAIVLLGSGLEANLIVTNIHLMEILPIDKRGYYMIFCDLFWTLGYFACASSMYATSVTNTSVIEHQGMDMRLTFWRLLFAVSGGFTLTMACISALLEISPRFLLYKKRLITATLTLKQFYAINKSKYSETFDIYSQDLYNLIQDYNINVYPEPVGVINEVVVYLKVTIRMMKVLLNKRFIFLNLTIVFIKLPQMFGIISLNIFLAQNFNKKSEEIISGLDFLDTISLENNGSNCTVTLNNNVSANFLLLSLNIFVGQILLMFIIDRIGRKIPIFTAMVSCSFACFVLAFKKNYIVGLVISSIFTIAYTIVESSINVVIMESFPTAIRATAMIQSRILSYLIVTLFYFFLNIELNNVLIIMGALGLLASLLSQFLPELKDRPMVE